VTTRRPLRIAIVVSSAVVPNWIATLVERLDASPTFEVGLYRAVSTSRRDWPWTYRTYERLDSWLFRPRRDALADAPLTTSDVRDLTTLGCCDVLIDLAAGDPNALGCAARYGVWTLSHVDEHERRVLPALFWETYERIPYETFLEARLEGGARRVLYRSRGRPNRTSLHRSRSEAYWKAQGAIIRALDRVAERGHAYLNSCPPSERSEARPLAGAPGSPVVLKHAACVALGVIGRRLRKLFLREEWFVALRVTNGESLVDKPAAEVNGFRALPAGRGEHFADPFIFEDSGRAFLFFERYDERAQRASIAFAALGAAGEPAGRPVSVLRPGYHVSYPFVFRLDDDIFLIPESLENESVDLYRAVEFPTLWTFERRLLSNIRAVDATLLKDGSRLWLFLNVAEPGASVNDELHLYSATELAGPWLRHPESPIVSDVARARPAGRIFRDRGHWIRPSQDCSHGYGAAVVFNRIECLTTAEYRETPIARVEPTWAARLLGTHTYNAAGGIEVVDGLHFARRLRLPLGVGKAA
jgi:hypothetical protein